ncbi:tetratricopeptide repeat protein [Maridesulfovibrio frigidus]|uniref:tetratricopeptide repeat protein n=1 Tax=Maridesulfovibrio frigidus TaxID=340956 RepID=UPI0004E1E9A7|nr:hypothetical protein [Maridesulfovibrio frigidus]
MNMQLDTTATLLDICDSFWDQDFEEKATFLDVVDTATFTTFEKNLATLVKARIISKSKGYDVGLEFVAKISSLDSTFAFNDFWCNALFALSRYEEMLPYIEKCKTLAKSDKQKSYHSVNKGFYYQYVEKEIYMALECYIEAARLYPNYWAHSNAYTILLEKYNYDEAEKFLNKCKELASSDLERSNYALNKGLYCDHANDNSEKALKHYIQAAEKHPNFWANNNAFLKLRDKGDYNKAEKYLNKCKKLFSNDREKGEFQYNSGSYCENKNKDTEALNYYIQSAKKHSNFWASSKLFNIYLDKGEYTEALLHLKKSSKIATTRKEKEHFLTNKEHCIWEMPHEEWFSANYCREFSSKMNFSSEIDAFTLFHLLYSNNSTYLLSYRLIREHPELLAHREWIEFKKRLLKGRGQQLIKLHEIIRSNKKHSIIDIATLGILNYYGGDHFVAEKYFSSITPNSGFLNLSTYYIIKCRQGQNKKYDDIISRYLKRDNAKLFSSDSENYYRGMILILNNDLNKARKTVPINIRHIPSLLLLAYIYDQLKMNNQKNKCINLILSHEVIKLPKSRIVGKSLSQFHKLPHKTSFKTFEHLLYYIKPYELHEPLKMIYITSKTITRKESWFRFKHIFQNYTFYEEYPLNFNCGLDSKFDQLWEKIGNEKTNIAQNISKLTALNWPIYSLSKMSSDDLEQRIGLYIQHNKYPYDEIELAISSFYMMKTLSFEATLRLYSYLKLKTNRFILTPQQITTLLAGYLTLMYGDTFTRPIQAFLTVSPLIADYITSKKNNEMTYEEYHNLICSNSSIYN